VRIPHRAIGSPSIAAGFTGEAQPVSVRGLEMAGTDVLPHKMGVISPFSRQLQRRSVPTVESIIRFAISTDTQLIIDSLLLSSTPASGISPAGLLNGVTPIAPAAGGGVTALSGDLGALAEAIRNPLDLAYIMSEAARTRALILAPGLSQVTIITAPTLDPKTVIGIDLADFASGESSPEFSVSSEALIHEEADTPLPISAGGTVAAPTRSLWQSDAIAIRFLIDCSFGMTQQDRIAVVEETTW
jgi:hypothetical protein